MKDELFNFERLQVYQKSLDYLDETYEIIKKFPYNERKNLSDQLRRASLSVSLNLAEGSGGTIPEFRNFIRISRRSVKECVVCYTVANRRKYITEEEDKKMRARLAEISRMSSALMNSI
jgi:four helix bundle protein